MLLATYYQEAFGDSVGERAQNEEYFVFYTAASTVVEIREIRN